MSSRKVARREFLKTGSAAAIGLSAMVSAENLFAASPADQMILPLLGVGYAPEPPEAGHSVRLAAAERVLVGDPAFLSRGARVTIRSFARTERHKGRAGGAAIDVVHPAISYTPEKYPRFRAWSYSTDRNAIDNVAAPAGFTVPVTATAGLQLVIRRIAGDAEAPGAEMPLALTLGSENGAMKLQRGLYVIAFRESFGDSVPPWGAHSVSLKNGQYVVDATAFSYAVLTIDYAK